MNKNLKDPGKIVFNAKIEQPDLSGAGAWVSFPYDLKKTFGVGNLVKIKATIDNIPYRGSLAKMGGPCAMLLVKKEIREKLGKQKGDKVHITVELDKSPRVINIPEDFKEALSKNSSIKEFFYKLSYSHKKEYVKWITDARKEETRHSRIEKAVNMLKEKKKLK